MHKPAPRVVEQVQQTGVRLYPDKLFYKIGEVSKIAEVEPYVLRYWETEFPFLRPRKSKSGQRIYVKKDLELILQVKDMLYRDRFTIEGVRKRLAEGGHHVRDQIMEAEAAAAALSEGAAPMDAAEAKPAPAPRKDPNETLKHVRQRLREILIKLG